MILAGLIAGIIAGAIMLFASFLAPYFGAGNYVSDVGRTEVMGQGFSRREAQFMGILVHLLVSGGYGAIYGVLVRYHLVPGTSFLEIMLWSLFITLFVGGVVLPLEGHGLFGTNDDRWFPVDMLLTNLGWGVLFWWLIPPWLAVLQRVTG